jgi:hypothetical protein
MDEIEKFLEGLRSKPLHVRKMILVASTTAITLFIAITWAYSFQGKLARLNGGGSAVASVASAPSSIVSKDVSSFWKGFSGLVGELKHQLSF